MGGEVAGDECMGVGGDELVGVKVVVVNHIGQLEPASGDCLQ